MAGKALRAQTDHVIEVNTASQHAVDLLVNLDSLQLGGDHDIRAAFQALTANALRTLGNVSNGQQAILLRVEDVAVTQCQIAILNKLGEELVALQALLADLLNDDLDDAEQVAALAIANCLQVDGGLAVVGLQQSLAQNFWLSATLYSLPSRPK